jgi:hypothetical protein
MHKLKVKLNMLSLRKLKKPMDLNMELMETMEGRHKFEHEMRHLGIDHLNIS